MKTNLFVEYCGKQTEDKTIIAAVKKAWTESGNKLGDMKTLQVYIKPEEDAVYYVVNESATGKIAI